MSVLRGIIAIAGMPGLYKLVGQMKNGIIVESLLDGKRFPAYASHKVSALDDISIYGIEDDIPLADVFKMLFDLEEGKASLSHKESLDNLKNRLQEAFEDADIERIYSSDVKKFFQWYNLLLEKEELNFEAVEEAVEVVQPEQVVEGNEEVKEDTSAE